MLHATHTCTHNFHGLRKDMHVTNAESLTGVEVVYLSINKRSTLMIIQLDLYNVKKQTVTLPHTD